MSTLLTLYNDLFFAHGINRFLDFVLLEFHKALDKVKHNKSMFKVKQLGIDGNVYKEIENYPSKRRQRVAINDIASDWASVTSGVP